MKTSRLALVFFATAVTLRAAPQVGDAYDKVIAELGAPVGVAEAGAIKIVRFKDQTIKFRDGRVVALEVRAASVVAALPAKPGGPARKSGAPAWTTDCGAALEQAQQQGRHVFLFFTGSDWCGWCKRLDQEILSTPEFGRYAADHLILVELDFPRNKPQSAAVVAQNAGLARKYRIRGYPTVIVLDSSGRAVGRLGYQEGGPGPFLTALDKM